MEGLSLILPVYNTEDYIENCLNSIIKSKKDLTNIQIIIIDDASTDRSGEISKEIAAQHDDFLYVYKENGGVSRARNLGIEYAKYDYITFVDCDDHIHEDYFELIFKSIKKKPDIILFDWFNEYQENVLELVKAMDIKHQLWTVHPCVWSKVFKKEVIEAVRFPAGKLYEDVEFTYKSLAYVKNYDYIETPLYYYQRHRKGSLVNTISPKVNDIYDVLDATYSFYQEKDLLTYENKKGLEYQFVKLLLWSNTYVQLQYFKFNLLGFSNKMKETRDLVNDTFPQWHKNTYIKQNKAFFEARLGKNYIQNIDKIGKSFFDTFYIIQMLVVQNFERILRK